MKKKSLSHAAPARLSTRHSLVHSLVGEDGFFRLRLLISVLLCFAGITVFLVLGKASAQPRKPLDAASKIAPWVIDHTANGQQTEFFVVLADQADLSGAVSL